MAHALKVWLVPNTRFRGGTFRKLVTRQGLKITGGMARWKSVSLDLEISSLYPLHSLDVEQG